MSFFTQALLFWNNKKNKRDMPWKGIKDPYKIWLSEIILQQTRVEQGWAYYEKITKRFPSIQQLAAAKDEEVFKLWEGLGYYSRCRNLLFTARYISNNLNGKFPVLFEEVLQLKGVGGYTAAAICSFAYDAPHAVVDGNVMRVIARYLGIETPIDTAEGKKKFQHLADLMLDDKQPGKYNQAIMDFGATICKPKLPLCVECPLSDQCVALKNNQVQQLPVKSKKLTIIDRYFVYLIIKTPSGYLCRKRKSGDVWAQLHEFVLLELDNKETPNEILTSGKLNKLLSVPFKVKEHSDWIMQRLTHRRMHAIFLHLETKQSVGLQDYEVVKDKKMAFLAFPKIIQQYLKERKQFDE